MLALDIIMALMMAATLLYGAYFLAVALLGAFRPEKRCPHQPPQKRIAAIIAARNESGVIAPLIESILNQHYPADLRDVFVVPNNCTDDTEQVARRAGARILNCTVPVHAKGEAVSWAIDELLKYPENYDAFIIVDADNLLDADYFQMANDALCAGAKVGQGYRDSKNYSDSWIAGCSSQFYWCMSRFYNRSRNALNMSAALNGTGILLSADYMRQVGWHTSSLTEDLEFTAQCALSGVRIWWLGDARAYDEQPNRFIDSYKQRRRWSAGTVQCMRGYLGRLVRQAVRARSLQCLDMAVLFTGPVVQLFSLLPGIYFGLRALINLIGQPFEAWLPWLGGMLGGLVAGFAVISLLSYLIFKFEGKSARGQWRTIFGLWLFLMSWIPANLVSLFTKPPKWVQIRHERALSMSDVKRADQSAPQPRRSTPAQSASKQPQGRDEPI